MLRVTMSTAVRFGERLFRCLLPPSPSATLSCTHSGNFRQVLTDLPFRLYSESVSPVKEIQHKHRQLKKPSVIDVLKGKSSVENAKNPISIFHECFKHVDNYNKCNNVHTLTKQTDKMFTCELIVLWPTEQVFVGVAPNKKGALREASTKALLALWKSGDITSNGLPILEKNPPPVTIGTKIALTPETKQSLTELHNHYKDVKPHIDLAKTVTSSDFGGPETENDESIDIIYNVPRSHVRIISQKKRYYRSLTLKDRLDRPRVSVPLPIDNYRTELLEAMENYRVILLRAETGSGKSSRYPQFILDHYASQGKGADCNIIITQPRRLTTVSLARHVARERNEEVGDVVGYNIRLDYVLPRPPGGCILYCTAGKLVQSLMRNPNLEGISHICLDEVHERHYDCDLIMGLLRRVLKNNPKLHLTLMSATLDPEELKRYFGDDCYVFDAPGRTYPVETHFLKSLPTELLQKNEEKTEFPMIARIIRWIDKKPAGGVLVFLPGWKEIQGVGNFLENDERFFVVRLHSNVSLGDQLKVHEKPPLGKRKVVLATNIAESSITIADIVYVVDYPYERIGRFSYKLNELEHQLVPCPKSRLLQRRGRAGRVQAGHCYHLLAEEEFNSLPEAPIPALLRMSLDHPILITKGLVREESVKSFFSELLTPPANDQVENGINSLQELGALDSDENVTPLGKRLCYFGVEPRPAKALVLSAIFRCQNTVAAYCAASEFLPFNIFSNLPNALKSVDVHPNSDHMVLINLFHLWLEMRSEHHAWQRLLQSSRLSLSYGECAMAYRFMLNLMAKLHSSKMVVEASPDCLERGELQKEELLKGILLNVHKSLGFVKKSYHRSVIPSNKVRLSTLSGKILIFARESVLYKKALDLSSPFVFHFPSVDTGAVVTSRCTSLMSSLSVLLFMPEPFEVVTDKKNEDNNIVIFNNLVKIELNKSDCETLLKLREAIWEIVDYFVRKEGTSEVNTVGYQAISDFRDQLTGVLNDILSAHAPGQANTDVAKHQVADLLSEEDK